MAELAVYFVLSLGVPYTFWKIVRPFTDAL
jgi:hypothetical protein